VKWEIHLADFPNSLGAPSPTHYPQAACGHVRRISSPAKKSRDCGLSHSFANVFACSIRSVHGPCRIFPKHNAASDVGCLRDFLWASVMPRVTTEETTIAANTLQLISEPTGCEMAAARSSFRQRRADVGTGLTDKRGFQTETWENCGCIRSFISAESEPLRAQPAR